MTIAAGFIISPSRIGISAGGALREAHIDLSKMFLFFFVVNCVCAAMLFCVKLEQTESARD